jgi:general stress protein 26
MSNAADIKDRFWEELSESRLLMVGLSGVHQHHQPMTAQLDEEANHAFWFYTTRDNRLAAGGPAMAQFAGKDHHLFACIAGTLVEETDPAVIDAHWSSGVAAWYEGGRDDPNLLMLRFDLGDAEIWLADLSMKGVFRLLVGGDVRSEMKDKHVEVSL